jgi:hypothetical protein
MHVLLHGQGICRPLGIKRHLPEADLVPVAEFVKNDVHIFGAKKHIAGVTLAAEADWGGHVTDAEYQGTPEAGHRKRASREIRGSGRPRRFPEGRHSR